MQRYVHPKNCPNIHPNTCAPRLGFRLWLGFGFSCWLRPGLEVFGSGGLQGFVVTRMPTITPPTYWLRNLGMGSRAFGLSFWAGGRGMSLPRRPFFGSRIARLCWVSVSRSSLLSNHQGSQSAHYERYLKSY